MAKIEKKNPYIQSDENVKKFKKTAWLDRNCKVP